MYRVCVYQVGLAVGDTQEELNKAELTKYKLRVSFLVCKKIDLLIANVYIDKDGIGTGEHNYYAKMSV